MYPSVLNHDTRNPGATTPSNLAYKETYFANPDDKGPGSTVKEEHWRKQQREASAIVYYYSKMKPQGAAELTIKDYDRELAAAERGERTNNLIHLKAVFGKMWRDLYGMPVPESAAQIAKEAADFLTVVKEEGIIR